MFLLDTCTLLWIAGDQTQLSATARKVIEKNPDSLFVSAITAFELAVKFRNGKLKLPLPVMDWYSEALDFHGIKELVITGGIAVSSAQLPPAHNDPCDRIIIATAQLNAMKILTCDRHITQYKEAEVVW